MAILSLLVAVIVQIDDDLHRRLAASSVEILLNGQLSGSGWIADGDGHVVTAAHVLWGQKGRIEAKLSVVKF